MPVLLLANVGVLLATLITGFAIHWVFGLSLMLALLFGSMISATDPISVLSIFEEVGVGKRLSTIVEGESLFNDGTAVVLFGILIQGISTGHLNAATGVTQFVVVVLGAAALGGFLGYVCSEIIRRIDEPRVEITLTTILAYSSYLLAESLHLSGVIATVAAGLMMGNVATRIGMSPRTRVALWSFWGYAAFVINSLLFLLIGMQVHIADLLRAWHATLLAIGAVLMGRALSVYALTPVEQSVHPEDSCRLAACSGVGRPARRPRPGAGLEPGTLPPASRQPAGLDLRRGRLLHHCAGPHHQTVA